MDNSRVYSNFILGAFGILNGQPAPFSGASSFVRRLIVPAILVSRHRGISRRDARKILARTLMIGDKTRGNFTGSIRRRGERDSPREIARSQGKIHICRVFIIMDKTYETDIVFSDIIG